MSRPNSHPKKIKLYDTDETRVIRLLTDSQGVELFHRREASPLYKRVGSEWRFCGYKLIPAPPSKSPDSAADLTLGDMLANVGLAVRPGGYVSPAREAQAKAKVKEFENHPGWSYRGPKLGYGIKQGAAAQ